MKVEKGVTVTMRDGVKLSLCVYRPDGPGSFPTLFAASPYQYEMDEVPAYPLFLWRETGPVFDDDAGAERRPQLFGNRAHPHIAQAASSL